MLICIKYFSEPEKNRAVLERFISCWENGKKSISGGDPKRKKFQKELLEISDELKKGVYDAKKLSNEVQDIVDGIINLANKIGRISNVSTAERSVGDAERTKTQQINLIVGDGDKLAERAKKL